MLFVRRCVCETTMPLCGLNVYITRNLHVLHFYLNPRLEAFDVSEVWITLRWTCKSSLVNESPFEIKILHTMQIGRNCKRSIQTLYTTDLSDRVHKNKYDIYNGTQKQWIYLEHGFVFQQDARFCFSTRWKTDVWPFGKRASTLAGS